MKENRSASALAIISGIYSSLGLVPHLLFLLILFLRKIQAPLGFLIPTYLASIFLGEYLFHKRMSHNLPFLDWLKKVLHPITPGYFFWAYISEILFDGAFLVLALKFNWNPLNFFLLLLGCKFLSAPFQVSLSYVYLSKNAGFALAVCTQVLLFLVGNGNPTAFLYVVILKGVLCNGIAVARSQYVGEMGSQTNQEQIVRWGK